MKKRLLSVLLALTLTAACMAGCSPAAEEQLEAAAEEPAAAAEEQAPAEETGTPEAPEEAGDGVHEIYKLMPDIALSGIVSPTMEDRAQIDKAWPKTPKNPDKISIGWSEINLSNDFFVALMESAEKAAKEYGYEISFLIANDDTQAQGQHVDTFITQDVDIIVVDPINASAPVQDINRAVEAGIPVICVGTVPEECNILTTFCTNPFIDGFESGKYAVKTFGADTEIMATVIIGVMGSSTSESRICGQIAGILSARMEALGTPYTCDEDAWLAGYHMFQELKASGKAASEETDFTILGMGSGDWTVEGGLKAAEDLATANANMNLILCENDFMAVGARKALKSAGINENVEIICAADGTAEGLEMIKSGEILCTGLGSPVEEAQFTIDFIHDRFEEGKDPSNLPMTSAFNVGIITSENVDEYYEEGNKFYKNSEFVFPTSIDEIKGN